MSVAIHEGLPGSGKTLRMLSLVEQFIVKDKRSVYLFNFKLSEKGVQHFAALAESNGVGFHLRPEHPVDFNVPFEKDHETGYVSLKFLGIEDGATLIFDEAQEYFKSRGMSKEPAPPFVQMLPTHRHSGYNIHFITQNVMYLDIEIRRIADTYTKYSRLMNWGYCRLDIFGGVKENPIEQKQALLESGVRFRYPKHLFELYTSSVDHNMKVRTPSRLKWLIFWLVLSLVLVGFSIYMFNRIIFTLQHGMGANDSSKDKVKSTEKPLDNDGSVSSSSQSKPAAPVSTSPVTSTVTQPIVNQPPPTSLGVGRPSVPDITTYNIYYSGYFTTYTPINEGKSFIPVTVPVINLLYPDGTCSRVTDRYFQALNLSLHIEKEFVIIFNVQQNVRHVLPLSPSPCVTNYVPPVYESQQQSPVSYQESGKSKSKSNTPSASRSQSPNDSFTDDSRSQSSSPYMFPSNPDSAPR
jgi:Zonular occludens toxin (Zot)